MNRLTRRAFLNQVSGGAACAAGAAGWGCATEPSSEARRPNFVVFLIDDLGWKDLGCYGSRFYETLNIDRLASQGMRFSDAYATCPFCSPTRASILTGQYPARLGITHALPGTGIQRRGRFAHRLIEPDVTQGLPHDTVTIAEELKEAGYATASIGKWHLGRDPFFPETHGFDVNVGGTQAGMVPSFFHPGWTQGRGSGGLRSSIPVEGEAGDYLTDNLSKAATKFIEDHNDKPFFLYLSHYSVHTPMEGKEDLVAKYGNKIDPDDPQNNPIYAAMIQSVDESVGRVLDQLEKLDLAGETVVLFTSDNGGLHRAESPTTAPEPPTSNIPLREGKGWIYEGGIRVPTIVCWPGVVEPGSVSDVPIASVDFYPTILEVVNREAKEGHAIDGVSLLPILEQTGPLPRSEIYWYFPHYDEDIMPSGAVRQGDYKLIEFFDDGRLELYNLRDDIGETSNLAEEIPEKTKELRDLLAAWLQSVEARPLVPNKEYAESAG